MGPIDGDLGADEIGIDLILAVERDFAGKTLRILSATQHAQVDIVVVAPVCQRSVDRPVFRQTVGRIGAEAEAVGVDAQCAVERIGRTVLKGNGHADDEVVGDAAIETHRQRAGERVAVAVITFVGYVCELDIRPEVPERGRWQIAARRQRHL